jgi:hypothetical protein
MNGEERRNFRNLRILRAAYTLRLNHR